MALQRMTTSSGLFVNELIFINCTDVQNKKYFCTPLYAIPTM